MNIRAKIYGAAKGAGEAPILKAKDPKGAKADSLDSVAVPREETRRSNSRYEDRHRLVEEQARVTHKRSDYDIELVNLSGGGAMVTGRGFAPLLWDHVELHLGAHGNIECAVRWIRGDRIGLEFAHETRIDCSIDERAKVLREVIRRSFPDAEFAAGADSDALPAPVESYPDDHRSAPRHPLIWSGTLHHDYQSTPIRVRNVSSSGAMIESAVPVRVGAEPLLEFRDGASVSASVEWAVGDQVGLRFHTEFDLALLAGSKPEVVGPSQHWSRPAYLDGQADEESAWDPHWKRLSVGELKQELEGFLKR